jgi:hypothetical protein
MESDILLTGSLTWIIVWSILGLKIGKEHLVWMDKMGEISKEGDLGKFWLTYDGFKGHVAAHAHAICFSSIAFALGLAIKAGLIDYTSIFLIVLSIWLLIGIVLASIGDYFRSLTVAVPGNILFLTGLIVSFVGLLI